MACLLKTTPQQVNRWREEGFLKHSVANFYEPMAAIRAIVNWQGRGRVPQPVIEWRARLGERPNRKAYLHGMAHAFDLISQVMERKYRPWGVAFYSYDPPEDEPESGGDGPEAVAEPVQAEPQPPAQP